MTSLTILLGWQTVEKAILCLYPSSCSRTPHIPQRFSLHFHSCQGCERGTTCRSRTHLNGRVNGSDQRNSREIPKRPERLNLIFSVWLTALQNTIISPSRVQKMFQSRLLQLWNMPASSINACMLLALYETDTHAARERQIKPQCHCEGHFPTGW